MYLENLAVVARKMSSDHQSIEKVIADTKERYAARDYEGALNQARSGKRLAEQLTGKYVEAHDLYEALEKLILNSERFYLDVRESRKLLNEARDAGETGDWTTMGILCPQGPGGSEQGAAGDAHGRAEEGQAEPHWTPSPTARTSPPWSRSSRTPGCP